MRFVLRLAAANLLRHTRRTLVTAIAIAVGIATFLFIDSMLKGVEYESERNLKWYETASAVIVDDQYWENRVHRPLEQSIEHPDTILDTLDEHGIDAAPRIIFSGEMILSPAEFDQAGNLAVEVTAVDTNRDFDVFHFGDTLTEGRFLEPNENGVLMGAWFAKDIGAEVGNWITIVTRGLGGFYQAMDLEIVGTLNCPNPNVNRSLLMMPIGTASEYLATEGAVTHISLKFGDSENIDKRIKDVEQMLDTKELEILSWEAMARDYLAILRADAASSWLILLLVFIIAAVGITNTMLMAFFERVRELGMMRALGMSDSRIRITFLLEAAGIGLIGSVFGIILGAAANSYLIYHGIDFGPLMRDMDIGYRIQAIFRGVWNPGTMVLALAAGTLLSMTAAYLPTRRALRMSIPDCLSHQ
jgi:ABC-type lipoprotein release transport system permease subunit